MGKTMIITVGTGIGADPEEAVRSLAHGIVTSIKVGNPDHIIFFVTNESQKNTIPEIKKQYPKLPSNESVLIKDMNDVNGIYEAISDKIKESKKNGQDVVADFTSGTKAMSAGAVLAATSEAVMLNYVTGNRIEGKVVMGEERVLSFSPIREIVESQVKILKALFNAYQYEACLESIRRIEELTSAPEIVGKLNKYRQIVEGYSFWDKFEHKKALERLKTFDNSLVNIEGNKRFLLDMERGNYKDYELMICDLMNNAKRRIEEGKYDDAVARLYRITELIAQIVLKSKYDIDSANVDTWQLQSLGKMEKKTIEKYEGLRDDGRKIKIALKKDFELLYDLQDELGKHFLDDKSMKDMLQKRNYSILAHGSVPVEEKDAKKMFKRVKEYMELVVADASSFMEQAAFPKL